MTTGTPTTGGMEEASFKPVEGGYLFETPNPWVFAPGRRYVVSEEQKRALLDIIRPRRPRLRVALISGGTVAFAIGVSALWWASSPRTNPSGLDVLGMTVTILIPLYALLVVWLHRYLRRIEPIVSVASPTQAKFTAGERYQAIGERMPTKFLVFGLVIWCLSAIASVMSLVTRGGADPLWSTKIFIAVTSLVWALLAAYLLYKRRRTTR